MNKIKKIFTIIIIIAVAFAVYTYFFKVDRSAPLLSTEGVSEVKDNVAERELLSLLLELRTVQLKGEIFDDPTFRSLNDFGQVLEPQPIGRENPFAPIGE